MFSIVIPIYNEAQNIKSLVYEIFNSLKDHNDFEVIIVNDFSSDNTIDVVNALQKKLNISLINNYLWVSTEYKLLCYNTDSEVIVPFDYVGNTNSIKDRIDVITKFYAVFYDGIKLYVATNQGIIAYNNVNSTWELITE